jgi:hypothetical protein
MTKGKAGRPEKPIDWEKVDQMLLAQTPSKSIAEALGVHLETFYDRVKEKYGVNYSEYAGKKQTEGKIGIRLKNYQKAMAGNIQMLLRLSEVYLEEFKEDNTPKTSPFQDDINKEHEIMRLKHENEVLKADANKLQAE